MTEVSCTYVGLLPLLCSFFNGGVASWLVVGLSIESVMVGLGDEEQYGNQEAARVGFEEYGRYLRLKVTSSFGKFQEVQNQLW